MALNMRQKLSITDLIKRVFDILLAIAIGLVMLPAGIIVALAIRMIMGSPVLFRQDRIGHRERIIRIIKFRTMNDARDTSGSLLPDEQRLGKLGAFIRRTSLDELPQLWNVLRGDMSIVGPRPLPVQYLPLYSAMHRRRHDVMPGLTGWAQINGRNNVDWERKLDLDVWYVDRRSLWLDLKIVLQTILIVLRGDGVSKSGHATMPIFEGYLHGQPQSTGAQREN